MKMKYEKGTVTLTMTHDQLMVLRGLVDTAKWKRKMDASFHKSMKSTERASSKREADAAEAVQASLEKAIGKCKYT